MTVRSLASSKPETKESQSEILSRLIDPIDIQEIFATDASHIISMPDGIEEAVFYRDRPVYEYGADGTKIIAEVVAKIVMSEAALYRLGDMIAAKRRKRSDI